MGYLGRDIQYGSFAKQTLTANSSTTVFTLSNGVADANNLLVSIGGIIQEPNVAYTAIGTVITFASAPVTNDPIFITFLGMETTTAASARDDVTYQIGTGNGTTTPITLSMSVVNSDAIRVSLNGVVQKPWTDFTASGTILTFSTAPDATNEILVYYIGKEDSISSVATGSVTAAKLTSTGTLPAWDGSNITGISALPYSKFNNLKTNLSLMGFRRSQHHGTSNLDLPNGFIDQFQDKTNVDDDASVNEIYNPDSFSTAYITSDRTSTVTVTTNVNVNVGVITALVNGSTTTGVPNSVAWHNQTAAGLWIQFQFPVKTAIDEAKWIQDNVAVGGHGDWKWQGSDNGSHWHDVGESFTLGIAPLSGGQSLQIHSSLNGNTNGYMYWRMYGVSGSLMNSTYLKEIQFKQTTTNFDKYYTNPTSASLSNTVLLISSNTTNGSTTISDLSGNSHAITAIGDAKHSTTQAKFGSTSLYCDGTGDRIQVADSADFAFTGDYTIEFWIFYVGTPANGTHICGQGGNSVSNYGFMFRCEPSGFFLAASSNGSTQRIITSSTNMSNAWHHVALVKHGTSMKLYIDGTSEGTPLTHAEPVQNVAANWEFGGNSTVGSHLNAYFDEIRFSSSARYTANFTPPASFFATSAANMTLISESETAAVAPEKAYVTMFNEPVDSLTLNTDIMAWVSRSSKTITATNASNVLNATAHGLTNGDRVILTSTWVDAVGQVPAMHTLTSPSGTVSANGELSTYEAWKAFDGNTSQTFWNVNTSTGYLQFAFNNGLNTRIISAYDLWNYTTAAAPVNWTIQASNTGSFGGEQVTLHTVTGASWSVHSELKQYTFSNTTPYIFYRMNITVNGGGADIAVAHLQFKVGTAYSTLPTGLSETAYHVVNKTANTFQVAATNGGAAITFTDDGIETHRVYSVTQTTLADKGDYGTGKAILAGTADISGQPTGTDVRLIVQTKNSKSTKLHGTAVQYGKKD